MAPSFRSGGGVQAHHRTIAPDHRYLFQYQVISRSQGVMSPCWWKFVEIIRTFVEVEASFGTAKQPYASTPTHIPTPYL